MKNNNINIYDHLFDIIVISAFLGFSISFFWFFINYITVISALIGVAILMIKLNLYYLIDKNKKISIIYTLFIQYLLMILGFILVFFLAKNSKININFPILAYGISLTLSMPTIISIWFLKIRR